MGEVSGFGPSWNKPPDRLVYTGKKYRLLLVKLEGGPESPKDNFAFLGPHSEMQCLDSVHEGVVCSFTTVCHPFCKGALQMYVRRRGNGRYIEFACHSCKIQLYSTMAPEYARAFWGRYERWVVAGAMEPGDLPFRTPFIVLPEHSGECIPVLELPVVIRGVPVVLGLLPSEHSLRRSHAALARRYVDLINLTKQDRDAITSHLGY